MSGTILPPYQASAMSYVEAGWSPLWLPLAKKSPPPKGYTGSDAKEPTEEVLFLDWMKKPGNIALKMPDTVIGIDFDRDKITGEQTGWKKFLELSAELGPLPVDVVSSSRQSLQDGFTAFFKVPAGVRWVSGIQGLTEAGELKGVADIIRRSHRYQVVSPSIHDKTGRTYEWRTFADNRCTPFIPEVDALPALPSAWIDYLTEKPLKAPQKPLKATQASLPAETPVSLGGLSCAAMRSKTGRRITELSALGTARHDAMVSSVMIIILMAHCGHSGGRAALGEYFKAWSSKFSASEATERNLKAEFDAAVLSARQKLSGPPQASCTCGKGVNRPVRNMSDIRRFN